MSSVGTKPLSDVRSEVYKPFYKVRFVPGDRVIYCGKDHLESVPDRGKELAWQALKPKPGPDYDNPPYAVGFPGKYDNLGITKDPRLGTAQRIRDQVFAKQGVNDYDDYRVSDSSDPDDSDEDTEDSEREEREEGVREVIVDPNMVRETVTYSAGVDGESDSDSSLEDEAKQLKRAKSFKDGIRRRYNDAVANEAQSLKYRDCKVADAAIKFYNDKHGTDFEIVETLGSYSRIYDGFWFHCNFRARRKSDAHHGRPSEPRLFFGELYRIVANTMVVDDCKMLDPPDYRIVRGCKLCGDQLWHPVNGFERGK